MLSCWTGIEFLKFLQDIRLSLPQWVTDFMIAVSSVILYLILPIVVFFIIYWFVDKRKGEFGLVNIFAACLISHFIKVMIREPRPYELDSSLTPVYEEASFSTPSGHASASTATFGSIFWVFRNKTVRILSFILLLLIVFSRMYLGVHTPLDITLGIFVTVALMITNWCLLEISYQNDRNYYIVGIGYLVFFFAIIAYDILSIECFDQNLATRSGFIFGILVARLVEHRYVKYDIPNCQLKNKVILGIIGIMVMAAIMIATFITDIPAVIFIGGFASLFWACAVFPYLMKNRVSFIGKFLDD